MGRIADEAPPEVDGIAAWSNRVDEVLDELDDDDDRTVVLSWLTSPPDVWSAGDIALRLGAYGFKVSDKSIQRWRKVQRLGQGRQWAA